MSWNHSLRIDMYIYMRILFDELDYEYMIFVALNYSYVHDFFLLSISHSFAYFYLCHLWYRHVG